MVICLECYIGCAITAGSVSLLGHEIARMPAADLRALRRTRVSDVAQSAAAAFNPFWRLERQVTELAPPEGRAALARDLFARLRLPDPQSFGRRFRHQVSGKQLQRAMIAMALANRPELVVFDEPTTALDVRTQMEVLAQIREVVAAQGCAALYISDDLAVVSQMADDILVLRHGRMVESGPGRQVVDAPATAYARALVAHRQGSATPPRAEAAPVLAAEGLVIGYGARPVVRDLALRVNRGELLAIVGESGSGKTTLTRRFAHRVVVMKEGRIVETGATGAIFEAPADPYTRHLLAAAQTTWNDRIRWFASLSREYPDLAVAELDRAHRAGAIGVMVLANVAGRSLTDPVFAPIWDRIDALSLPVLVHPTTPPGARAMDLGSYDPSWNTGFRFDTTLAVGRMILDGFLDRFQKLRIIASHGGGGVAGADRAFCPGP